MYEFAFTSMTHDSEAHLDNIFTSIYCFSTMQIKTKGDFTYTKKKEEKNALSRAFKVLAGFGKMILKYLQIYPTPESPSLLPLSIRNQLHQERVNVYQ